MPELVIIIVNWNGADFLADCLRSIVENPPSVTHEIVVVDNASSDGSVAWMKSDDAKALLKGVAFRLIETGENLGFGRANNLVIDQTNSAFVFLLNPDTRVTSGAIARLIETIKLNDKIGGVAPKLLSGDGSHQPNVWAFPPTATKVVFEGLRLYRLLPPGLRGNWLLSRHWDYSQRRRVPVFSGAAMMVRREMIEDVGAFDPAYHMFGEDAEWCVRMGRKGWLLFFEPEAKVYHLGGQSAVQRWGVEGKVVKEEEGQQQFMRHCLSPFQMFKISLVRVFITQIYRAPRWLLGRETSYLDTLLSIQQEALATSFRRLVSRRR